MSEPAPLVFDAGWIGGLRFGSRVLLLASEGFRRAAGEMSPRPLGLL